MPIEDWTDDRVRILEHHWKKDKSAREIAEMIGMPRNAVIGKAQRLGLGASPPPPTKRAERLAGSPRKRRQAQAANPPTLAVVSGRRVTMAELTGSTCRFPFGDRPRDPLFCGAPPIEDSPYCAHHEVLCHQPVPAVRTDGKQSATAGRLGGWT